MLRLQRGAGSFKIKSKVPGDPLDGKTIALKHDLDNEYVRWHWEWFRSKRT